MPTFAKKLSIKQPSFQIYSFVAAGISKKDKTPDLLKELSFRSVMGLNVSSNHINTILLALCASFSIAQVLPTPEE
jgi:hypothetical protein